MVKGGHVQRLHLSMRKRMTDRTILYTRLVLLNNVLTQDSLARTYIITRYQKIPESLGFYQAYVIRLFVNLVTTPAPTVRPLADSKVQTLSSIAIGASNLTLKVTVSPGITISLSAGNSTSPVTSVVGQ